MHGRSRQTGFTLLEIMIAVFVTGMLATGVWQVMNNLIAARDGVDRVSGEFERVRRTVMLLERDLFQAVERSIRDEFGDEQPSLYSRGRDAELELTRLGWRNPLGERRSEMQRVAWHYDEAEERLVRRYWQVLDRAQDSEPREQELLDQVTAVNVRFLNQENAWVDDWPPEGTDRRRQGQRAGQSRPPSRTMPRAVDFEFTHERFGTINRVIELAGRPPSESLQAPEGEGAQNRGTRP